MQFVWHLPCFVFMATWRVLYRVLGTCFLPFHPVAHFKKCPQHFRAPSPSGTSTLYPTLSLSLAPSLCFPAQRSADALRKLLQHLVNCHFGAQHPLQCAGWRFEVGGGTTRKAFIVFGVLAHFLWFVSFCSIYSYTSTCSPSPPHPFPPFLALPFLISRILLRIVSHSVPHYLCISIPVRRQGDVSLKDAFLLPRPPFLSSSKGAYRLRHSCDSLPASSLAAPQL